MKQAKKKIFFLPILLSAILLVAILTSPGFLPEKTIKNYQNTSSAQGWPVLVMNSASSTVESVNSSTDTETGLTTLSGASNDIVMSSDGECYITSNANDTVSISFLNSYTPPSSVCNYATSQKYTTTGEPENLAVTPDFSTFYTTILNSAVIDQIDPKANLVTAISIPGDASGIAYDPGNNEAIVSIPSQHSVVLLSGSTRTIVEAISLPSSANPSQILLGPNYNHAYVMDSTNDAIYKINLDDFTVSTLDLYNSPTGMAISPSGNSIYYTVGSTNSVFATDINGNPLQFSVTFASGSSPNSIQVTPDGQNLFVTLTGSNSVADIKIASQTSSIITSDGTAPTALTIGPDQAPTAIMTSTGEDTVDSTVTFYAEGSETEFGSIVSYSWNFGDGSTADTTEPYISHVYNQQGTYNASVTVTNSSGTSTDLIYNGITAIRNGSSAATAKETVYVTGFYYPVTPTRICDTRVGTNIMPNQCNLNGAKDNPLLPQTSTNISVVNINNDGVPSYATAVTLNITAVSLSGSPAGGFFTVWPTGSPMPIESTQNFVGGDIVPHEVQVQLGQNGQISVYNFNGSTELIVDVLVWIGPDIYNQGNSYVPISPYRICDTRPYNGTTVVKNQCDSGSNTTLSPSTSESLSIQVTGIDSIPSNATAVVANITATDTTEQSYVTAWGSGTEPNSSDLNWTSANQSVANELTIPLSSSGTFNLANYAGSTDIIVDVNGYYLNTSSSGYGGSAFVGINPVRICDTRMDSNNQCTGKSLNGGSTLNVQVGGMDGIPTPSSSLNSDPPLYSTSVAVVANVTVADNSGPSYLTAWQGGNTAQPNSSNLNWTSANSIVSNTVIIPLNSAGGISIYNYSGSTDIIVDIMGYYVNNPGLNKATTFMLQYSVIEAAADYTQDNGQFGQYSPIDVVNELQMMDTSIVFVMGSINSTGNQSEDEVGVNACGNSPTASNCQWIVMAAWAPQTSSCYYVFVNKGMPINANSTGGTWSGPAVVNGMLPQGTVYGTSSPGIKYLSCNPFTDPVTNATLGTWPII